MTYSEGEIAALWGRTESRVLCGWGLSTLVQGTGVVREESWGSGEGQREKHQNGGLVMSILKRLTENREQLDT